MKNSILVVEEKFSYLWIEKNSVIFWNDETKTLGVVCSNDMDEILKSIEEWYNDLDKLKIDNDIYLIGQINHI